MQTRRRAEIILETEEVLMVRHRRFTEAWCEQCGESVAVISDEDAATLTGTSLEGMRHGAASGEFHAVELADNRFTICLKGLFHKIQIEGEKSCQK